MASKNVLQSKTMWVNALAILGGFLTFMAGELTTGSALTVAGFANIVLRFITKEGVHIFE